MRVFTNLGNMPPHTTSQERVTRKNSNRADFGEKKKQEEEEQKRKDKAEKKKRDEEARIAHKAEEEAEKAMASMKECKG